MVRRYQRFVVQYAAIAADIGAAGSRWGARIETQ